ncbi:caskin-1-like [Ananas comosus]|uniref:Caskin-1-like n=1 Tax=Ananas comosus TaxID=4615 RepID=A0A6P5EZU3_ANACO|nr:caskin-1-like [Ananas comosus]
MPLRHRKKPSVTNSSLPPLPTTSTTLWLGSKESLCLSATFPLAEVEPHRSFPHRRPRPSPWGRQRRPVLPAATSGQPDRQVGSMPARRRHSQIGPPVISSASGTPPLRRTSLQTPPAAARPLPAVVQTECESSRATLLGAAAIPPPADRLPPPPARPARPDLLRCRRGRCWPNGAEVTRAGLGLFQRPPSRFLPPATLSASSAWPRTLSTAG